MRFVASSLALPLSTPPRQRAVRQGALATRSTPQLACDRSRIWSHTKEMRINGLVWLAPSGAWQGANWRHDA